MTGDKGMKRNQRKRAAQAAAVSSAIFLGLAAGSALASPADHANITLKDYAGNPIVQQTDGSAKAYSVKTTCFTSNCHGDAVINASNKAKFSYDEIERHSYHSQLGANEFRGFNPYNADAYNPYTLAGDKWRSGAGPVGKNWVQSPGHVGSW